MRTSRRFAFALLLAMVPALGLTACSPAGDTDPSAGDQGAVTDSDGSNGDAQGPGFAVLTVGSESWEFDEFLCVFGHEANESDEYAFVGFGQGEHTTGARIQLFVQIRDDRGQGRYDGDDVIYEIEMFDVDDLEDPSVHLVATSDRSYGDVRADVTIDGDDITATGTFFEDSTFGSGGTGRDGEIIASCGADSIR